MFKSSPPMPLPPSPYQPNSLAEFKRRAYIWIICSSVIIVTIIRLFFGPHNVYDGIILAGNLIIQLTCIILLRRSTRYIIWIESGMLIFLLTLSISGLSYYLYFDPGGHSFTTAVMEYTLWSPFIYLVAVFTFGVNIGLFISLGHWMLTLGMSIGSILLYIDNDLADVYTVLIKSFSSEIILIFTITLYGRLFRHQNVALNQAELHAEQQTHYALVDPLTALPNRRHFQMMLEHTFKEAKVKKLPVAIMFFDIDDFKIVNDSLGHHMGDALLIALAKRIKEHSRQHDFVARWGGDEFAMVMHNLHTSQDAMPIAHKILQIFKEPFILSDRNIVVSTSIGIAQSEPVELEQVSATDLLIQADKAMYHAKASGKNCIRCFSDLPPIPSPPPDTLQLPQIHSFTGLGSHLRH